MTTQRLYDADGYLTSCTAQVTACAPAGEGWRIALDRTCFFPEGGGQYGDQGTLVLEDGTALSVRDTQEEDGAVWHHTARPLEVGTPVRAELNWPLRFARMQCHTGEHIVSGLFHRLYGLDNVGFHLGDEEVTVDLSGPVAWEDVQRVERLANEAVSRNLPVSCTYPAPEELSRLDYRSKGEIAGPVRVVTIPGYDVCACCAPHVRHTGEIGLIHFLSLQNWKGGVRLRMLSGSRAVEDVIAKQASVSDISNQLSAKQGEVAQAVARLCAELEETKLRAAHLGRLAAQALADGIAPGEEEALFFLELDTKAQRALVNAALQRGVGLCGVFAPAGERWNYIVGCAPGRDLRGAVRELNTALNGRGGGSAGMIQGSVQAGRAQIEAWWRKFGNES